MSKALCEALGIEWDGKEYNDDDKSTIHNNYATYGGGGAGVKNGHYGCKHSDEAKMLMRMAKIGKTPWNKNVKGYTVHNETSKRQMGDKLSGSGNGRSILNEEIVESIVQLYLAKPTLQDVGKIKRNGVAMSYDWAFSMMIAEQYKITPAAIKRLVQKKSWKHVWQKYQVSDKD